MDGPTFTSILAWGLPMVLIVVCTLWLIDTILKAAHRQ